MPRTTALRTLVIAAAAAVGIAGLPARAAPNEFIRTVLQAPTAAATGTGSRAAGVAGAPADAFIGAVLVGVDHTRTVTATGASIGDEVTAADRFVTRVLANGRS